MENLYPDTNLGKKDYLSVSRQASAKIRQNNVGLKRRKGIATFCIKVKQAIG
jgi:hypothetical protein